MTYIPYVTAVPVGAITRNPTQLDSLALGKLVNYMQSTYASHTGYTQQHYNNASIYTPQFQSFMRVKGVDKDTPKPISYSNLPRGV